LDGVELAADMMFAPGLVDQLQPLQDMPAPVWQDAV
jgi:hypothetical protein